MRTALHTSMRMAPRYGSVTVNGIVGTALPSSIRTTPRSDSYPSIRGKRLWIRQRNLGGIRIRMILSPCVGGMGSHGHERHGRLRPLATLASNGCLHHRAGTQRCIPRHTARPMRPNSVVGEADPRNARRDECRAVQLY